MKSIAEIKAEFAAVSADQAEALFMQYADAPDFLCYLPLTYFAFKRYFF